MDDEDPHLTKTEARAGSAPGIVRIVLMVSLVLIVGIFIALLLFWRQ
ncbi:MAG: hypothetical protein H7X93_08510 [Sphingomonadaceae bacterium]|nr:hypothetical protein [Sphingomonadaceae bacterium]